MIPIDTYWKACAYHFMLCMSNNDYYNVCMKTYEKMCDTNDDKCKSDYKRATAITKLAYSLKNDKTRFKNMLDPYLTNAERMELIAVLTPAITKMDLHKTLEYVAEHSTEGWYLMEADYLKAVQEVITEVKGILAMNRA